MGDLWVTSRVCMSLRERAGAAQCAVVAGTASHQRTWLSVSATSAVPHPPPLLVPLSKLLSLLWLVSCS